MGSTENFARLRDIAVHDSCRVNDDHSTPSGKGKEHKGLKGLTARGILSTPPPPESYGRLEIMFAVAQGIAILMFGLFTEYAEGVHPIFTNSDTTTTDTMQSMYAFFQDVHVMIFIGFGFLMTFLKTANWSALCFTWVISIWALQWGILSNGLWHQVIPGGKDLHKIEVTIKTLILGDFGAAAAMISFGALLGKCNLQQLFFLVFWEMFFWGLNESLGAGSFKATDMGGSMFVHAFGAYYGLAASYFFQPNRSAQSKNAQSNYQSNTIALIGSIFLWMYWPAFNGALATGVTQQRVVINSVLSIAGSCMGAAAVARVLFGKLEMEIMLNATLAGGVAIGTSSDLVVSAWVAMLVGFLGGAFSAVCFQKLGPFLAQKINLQDTCGVNSLHGLPGIMGVLVSTVVIATSSGSGFPDDYFPVVADGGSLGGQVAAQIEALLVTLGISIAAGASGGFLCKFDFWHPVHALFKDDDHFYEVVEHYPREYLFGGDEVYDEGKANFHDVQHALSACRAQMHGDAEQIIDKLMLEVWAEECGEVNSGLSFEQAHVVMQAFIHRIDPELEISTAAFDYLLKHIELGSDSLIHREEMATFIKVFTRPPWYDQVQSGRPIIPVSSVNSVSSMPSSVSSRATPANTPWSGRFPANTSSEWNNC